MGSDNITLYLLKTAVPYIVESPMYLYNLCIEQNMFQTALKNAKVVFCSTPQNQRFILPQQLQTYLSPSCDT